MGQSLYEPDRDPERAKLLETCDIPVPTDIARRDRVLETATATVKQANEIQDNEQILDMGDVSASVWPLS
ncbi:hypothetical protein M8494_26525 [Serratia ureilytica]